MNTVAYVINRIENGGPSNVIRSLIHSINMHQYRVIVITLFENADSDVVIAEFAKIGAEVINLGYHKNLECFLTRNRLKRVVAEQNVDIIHSHGFIPDYLSESCNCNCKKISTLHCRLFEDYPEVYGTWKGNIFAKVHLHILRRLAKVICCSKAVYTHVNLYLPNSTYIENGIDMRKSTSYDSRESLGLPVQGTIYIYIGQLRRRKNVVWLVNQFVKTHKSNEYLVILGKGAEENDCKNIADSNVLIMGFKNNVNDYLAASDIYISASLSEGFSISALEALQNGLGLFLSDIPSHKELFEIDNTYYIGEFFDKENFAVKLQDLRNNFDRINHAEIEAFKERYLSARHMTECYEKYYTREL